MFKSKIELEIEREASVLREAEARVAEYRQALDGQTMLLIKTSGKLEGLRAALRIAGEDEAAGAAGEPAGVAD